MKPKFDRGMVGHGNFNDLCFARGGGMQCCNVVWPADGVLAAADQQHRPMHLPEGGFARPIGPLDVHPGGREHEGFLHGAMTDVDSQFPHEPFDGIFRVMYGAIATTARTRESWAAQCNARSAP